ncbi:zinc finger CCCH-type antiviral protein 1-like [Ruditapes philippinarum]|uniref:zinc finger CCCH-type antiviral protein 1-like n=1 Tax=Ruditapes philippinarum TaxID=129788 RepID=UPI00295A6AF4|nr:zinc finger CCCH-type antiviral protein 1-like [Ruditapes philippinarum]
MTIDFQQMSGTDNIGGLFEIERLSTPSLVNRGNQTWRTNWLWYWQNPYGEWIKFGDLDDYGGNKAEIKSKDLEEAFVADPTGVVKFKTTGTQSYEYIVEFSEMIQRNTAYNTRRELRRRPEFIIKLDFELNRLRLVRTTDSAVSKGIKAPANWGIPKGKDLFEHIVIVKGSIFTGVFHI